MVEKMLVSEEPPNSCIDLTIHVQTQEWSGFLPNVEELSERVIAETLKILNLHKQHVQLSVVLADDDFVRIYNKQYRSKDKATNVLSFSALHESRVVNDNDNLGDIMLAFQTVEKEAKEQHKAFEDHYVHLLIHGVLHLIGYDHQTELEAQEMEAIEIQVLSIFGVPNPYDLSA